MARRNVLLVRLAERLSQLNRTPPQSFLDAVAEERQDNARKMQLLCKVSQVCSSHGIEHVFAKAFQHHPDMGCDLDLFVPSSTGEVDALVIKVLGASRQKGGLCDRIAGRTNYQVSGCAAPLEIHHGRVGIVGENRSYLATLIENGRHSCIAGQDFLIPSPEDQLTLQGIQKVYGRLSLRLADVISTISTIRRDGLDWDYIIKWANRLGTFHGLCCYLSYVEQIHEQVLGGRLFSEELRKALVLRGWGQVEFREGCYRVPGVGVSARLYLRKFQSRVLAGDWGNAGRLCLLPLASLEAVCTKLWRSWTDSGRGRDRTV
jgi:hypothetical protein